jgi:alcohol dehydrogenase
MRIAVSNEPQEVPGSRVKVAFGPGSAQHLGAIAAKLGARKVLLVSDPGIVKAGHAAAAIQSLRMANISVDLFSHVAENPTTEHVSLGVQFAQNLQIDFVVGLGGGSSMDCAKGINFILTNSGRMQDYWGVGKAKKPLLPMIAIPCTAGTGSDAQSFAIIADPATHQKMACGDPTALPRVAILDPILTHSQPPRVARAVGIDAISHAVESSACNKRNDISRQLSKAAWDLLEPAFEKAIGDPKNLEAAGQMLAGAHLAGAAIENSMLGAAHSLANALTALAGVVHGVAVGLVLPHVVRFNSALETNPYADIDPDAHHLAARLGAFLVAADLPRHLSDVGVSADQIDSLAAFAAKQWTAAFNPRPVGEAEFREILHNAL